MLTSQLSLVQESNNNLHDLLHKSNNKINQLMKELTDKNRFIKEYIEEQREI
jgi:cell division protein FtsB